MYLRSLAIFVVLGTSAVVSAQDDGQRIYDDGRVHFTVDELLSVSTSTHAGHEGEVYTVLITPVASTGQVAGGSFVMLTLFENDIHLERLEEFSPELRALDVMIEGVSAALGDSARISPEDAPIDFAGGDMEGMAFTVYGAERPISVRAGAIPGDGFSALVYYDQRDEFDQLYFDSFDQIVTSFGFGPAPVTDANDTTEVE